MIANDNFMCVNLKKRPHFNNKLACAFMEIVCNHPEYDMYLLRVLNDTLTGIKSGKINIKRAK